MMPDAIRELFHHDYRAALIGTTASIALIVTERGGDRRVRFDGIRGDALTVGFVTLEARSSIPAKVGEDGELTAAARDELIADAQNQVAVAAGRPVLWACERAQDAYVLDRLFDGPLAGLRSGGGVVGIEVAHLPYDVLLRQWHERAEAGLWTPRLDRMPPPAFGSSSESAPEEGRTSVPGPQQQPQSPQRTSPVQPSAPVIAARPKNFGLGSSDLMDTSLVVPLGVRGPYVRSDGDLPRCDVAIGGETVSLSGAEVLIWSLCATRPPGTTTASIVAELRGGGSPHAVDTLFALFAVGLLAQVDTAEPAAVYEFAQTYRLLPVVTVPSGGRPGEMVRVENDEGGSVRFDSLIASVVNEGMTSRNLVEACTPYGKVRGPDSRPRMFKSPNLLRRHRSVVHENGIVGWVLEQAIPVVGEGVLGFDVAVS